MLTRILLALASACFAAPVFGSDPPVAILPEPPAVFVASYTPSLPAGSERFTGAAYTQAIAILNERDEIRPVPIRAMSDRRWHQPGGLEGVEGWRSEKYRYLPAGQRVRAWVGNIGVRNSYGFLQQNRGLLRSYPDGTRFDELLINDETGTVFEHRVREKVAAEWKSTVHHKDEAARPKGYEGLKVSCSSCHAEAGTGAYAEGLVPGGDTVLSDPLEWSLWMAVSPESQPLKKVEQPKKADPPAAKVEPKKVEPAPAPKTLAPVVSACPGGVCRPAAQARPRLFPILRR